jgi:NADH-quinone oxidoreductase subunit G
MMTVEEAYLLAKVLKGISPSAKLALGPVPAVGEDDAYPKTPSGKPAAQLKFTIRAEKCPNRIGVEAVLKHFEKKVVDWSAALHQIGSGSIKAAFLFGGYPAPWISDGDAATLKKLEYLVVEDILPSPASAAAHAVLPGASFAEKDGTVVNYAALAQALRTAIRSPGDARADGRILMDLAERKGLFHVASLRKEIAAEIPYFAALASGDPGEFGVRLGAAVAAAAVV